MNLWARSRRWWEAEDCLWRKKLTPQEKHELARRPGHREVVTAKLAAIFPGLADEPPAGASGQPAAGSGCQQIPNP